MRTNTTFCMVVLSLLSFAAYGLDQPGWFESEGEHIPYGQTPSGTAGSEKRALDAREGGMALLGAPDDESPEIEELARNLQYDPVLIYTFVRNKIDYVPYYGFLKGATQTLLDRAGNDADQSALLAALLRASGYTATYRYGYQYIPTTGTNEQTAARWFDVEDSAAAVDRTIYRNGIPGNASNDWTIVDRIWVETTITGQVYRLDAAFKPHTRPTRLDLASAMGYNRSNLLLSAGGESTTNYARNLSETNFAKALCTLSSNLLSALRADYANSEIEDIIGKSAIIPADVDSLPTSLPFYTVSTETWSSPPSNLIHTMHIHHGAIDQSYTLPEVAGERLAMRPRPYDPITPIYVSQYPVGGSYGMNFGHQPPNTYVSEWVRLRNSGSQNITIHAVAIAGLDANRFYISNIPSLPAVMPPNYSALGLATYSSGSDPSIHQASVSFYVTIGSQTFWTNILPLLGRTVVQPSMQLWREDTLVAEESLNAIYPTHDLQITIDHPYAAWTNTYLDQNATFTLKRGASYAIVSDFGSCGAGQLLDGRRRKLDWYRRNGFEDTSREVLTETLNIFGQSWMSQTVLSETLMNRIANVNRTYHHRFGVMAQEEGYYVDVKAQVTATTARDGDTSKESAHFRAGGLLGSALEHGVLEQLQGTNKPGVSTVRLLQIANSTGQKIFFANPGNYASIQPQLTNYSAEDLASFSTRIGYGQTLILPENAQITLQEWQGKGYIVHGPGAGGYSEVGMIIGGGYYGGYSAIAGAVNTASLRNNVWQAQMQPMQTLQVMVNDPVDIASGQMTFAREDIRLGSGVPPTGLSLKRFYNSGQINLRSSLGYGWHHNLDIRAQVRSEGAAGLGLRSPADAAALLVASVVIDDLAANENNAKGWATAVLASKWAIDQLNENAVSIQIGNKNLDFVRLPDGTYSPPPGSTATLVKSNGLFRLEERFGVKLDFNAQGKLATWKDADNNTMSFSYNAQTNLQGVSDAFSRSLTFTYSGSNLTSVADSSGRSVSYSVTSGNLATATDSEGFSWSFGYDSERRLLWINDPLGQRTVSNRYSATSGRVLSQLNGAGQLWNMFVVPQFRGAEQNPFGDSTVYLFDDKTRQVAQIDALGNESHAAYDGQNHVVSQWDAWGNLTQHQYDNRQNRTNAIDALGRSTAYSYDSQNRLVQVTDALGHRTTTGYDSEHHPTNTMDAASNVATIAYFANGLVQSVTGPCGEVTSYTYDAYGNPATITRIDGGIESRTWNTRGDLLTLTDANTNTTTFTYDKRRLQTSERDPYGKAVSNIYNAAGLLVTTLDKRGFATTRGWTPTYKGKSIQYPDGASISNTYDAADRLVAVRDPMGFVTSNRFDKAGRVVAVVNPRGFVTSNRYDQAGNLIAVRDPEGNITSNQHDALNRVVKTTDALGFSVSNEFNEVGWLTATVDQEGKRTEYEHDALGRVTLERRRDVEYRFEYDAAGNRTAFINPKGIRSMTYGFDKMSRLVSETNALGHVTRYVFDPVGNVRQKINANGQTIQYTYDDVNRLINRQSAIENVSFWYDANGNMTNMIDALGTTRQTFDAMNRLTTVVDPFNQTVSNTYNLAGRRTQLTYPDGKVEDFAYNPNGSLTNVLASSFGIQPSSFSYDSCDNLTGAGYPGGLTASYVYDDVNRLSSWSVAKAGSNLLARSCTRNGLGFKETESITAGLETLDGPLLQTRQLDAADRIAGVWQNQPGATNFPSYDAAGNLTQLVLSVRGQTFTTRYNYDFNNWLTRVERLRNASNDGSVTTSLVQLEYSGQGLLLRITENGAVRRLVRDRIDALARPLVETDAAGNATRWFVWANGRLLSQVDTNETVRVVLPDELGRTLALTDTNGVLTDEYAYHAYGRTMAHTGASQIPFTWLGAFGVLDIGHGLYLARHRAYDANLASFTQADPVGLAGGWNLYIYGSAHPLFFMDILGLCPDSYSGYRYGSSDYAFTQGGISHSSYAPPALRSPVTLAEKQHWTDLSFGRVPLNQAQVRQAELTGNFIEGAIISRFGPVPGRTPADILAVNRVAGQTAEQIMAANLISEGNVILGSHVAARTSQGLRIIDHLVRSPADDIFAIEVKSGMSVRSASQLAKDSLMATEGAILVGRNAPEILQGQQLVIDTIVRTIW